MPIPAIKDTLSHCDSEAAPTAVPLNLLPSDHFRRHGDGGTSPKSASSASTRLEPRKRAEGPSLALTLSGFLLVCDGKSAQTPQLNRQ